MPDGTGADDVRCSVAYTQSGTAGTL